jgi:Type II secretion system (T2SS), protein M subtype b
MTLFKRILVEKRAVAIPVFLVLLANILAYAIVVFPLGVKSAGAGDRAVAAAAALKAAEADQAAAEALVKGKSTAERELATFYDKVVPTDLLAARRVSYAPLPALARKSNVRYQAGTFAVEADSKTPRLSRLRIRMILQGEWENVRRFIYELETSSAFVILDEVTVAQTESNEPLTLTLDLSTYFRARANGI